MSIVKHSENTFDIDIKGALESPLCLLAAPKSARFGGMSSGSTARWNTETDVFVRIECESMRKARKNGELNEMRVKQRATNNNNKNNKEPKSIRHFGIPF